MCDGQQKTSRTAVHREGVAHSKPGSRAGPASAECCSPKVQHIPLSCRVSCLAPTSTRMTSRSATRPVHSVLGASMHSAQRSEQKDSFQFIGHSSGLDFDARPPCTSTEVASGSREGRLYFTVCICNIDTKWT